VNLNADQALEHFLRDVAPAGHVLDIGCGGNIKPMLHTPRMRQAKLSVDALDMNAARATIHAKFEDYDFPDDHYDGVWASHMLEHAENVGEFLQKCRRILKPGGIFAVTVPPIGFSGHLLVPGHLSLWTPALLCYNLIVAGWDLRNARLGTYEKNISVVVPREDAKLPKLSSCRGDIEKLQAFFPTAVSHACDANLPDTRWKS